MYGSLRSRVVIQMHHAYVFFDVDDVKFLKDIAWLWNTLKVFVQMNSIQASIDLKRHYKFARLDRCGRAGYLVVCNAEENHRRYSALEGLKNACDFPRSVHPNAQGTTFVPSRNVRRVLHVRIKLVSREKTNSFGRFLGSLEPKF